MAAMSASRPTINPERRTNSHPHSDNSILPLSYYPSTTYPNGYQLAQSNLVGVLALPSSYVITFDIYPTADGTGWRSILHLTGNGQDYNSVGGRLPNVELHESYSRKLQTCYEGTPSYTCLLASQELPLNTWSFVTITVDTVNKLSTLALSGGSLLATQSVAIVPSQTTWSSVQVYASNPWYAVAAAKIRNLKIDAIIYPTGQPSRQPTSRPSTVSFAEGDTLCNFYDTLSTADKAKLTNWCSGAKKIDGSYVNGPCSTGGSAWYGVACTSIGGVKRVTRIDISSNCVISGTIPSSIGGLGALTFLGFHGDYVGGVWRRNSMAGSLPSQIGLLTKLVGLNLGASNFSGSLPSELGNMRSLTYLDIHINLLSFSVPTEIGLLTKLVYLDLSQNRLIGTLPSDLGSMAALTFMSFTLNSIKDVIPSQLGLLTKLASLTLDSNYIESTIPTSILSMKAMTYLNLGSNKLIGSLPSELYALSNLARLYLHTNKLSGEISSAVGRMQGLTWVVLQSTSLTGSLPSELFSLTKIGKLDLSFSRFVGTIHPSIGQMKALQFFGLRRNSLQGTIPKELGGLTGMTLLYLDSNSLSGTIPDEIGDMTNLATLLLSSNKLTGAVPNSFCQLSKPCAPGYFSLASQGTPGLSCIPSCLTTHTSFSWSGTNSKVCIYPTGQPSRQPSGT